MLVYDTSQERYHTLRKFHRSVNKTNRMNGTTFILGAIEYFPTRIIRNQQNSSADRNYKLYPYDNALQTLLEISVGIPH